jgi:DNA-binding GntR family transcriptional regulator
MSISRVAGLEEALARQILDGHFRPGEHLGEISLAVEYHVGRNTLRAALDGVARRGLAVKVPNCGVFVRILTARDLGEVYELRTAIEVQASRTLAARGVVPEAAQRAFAHHRGLGERSPQRAVVEADLAFHRAVVAGTGNARLIQAYEALEGEILLCLTQLVRGYAGVGQLAGEHGELLAAIERADPDSAERFIRHHLEGATAWLVGQASTPGGGDTAQAEAPARSGMSMTADRSRR